MSVAAYDAFFDVGGSDWQLGQIFSSSLQSNGTPFKGRYSGGLDPQFIALLSADPMYSLVTGDLATLLANVDIDDGYYMNGSVASLPLAQRAVGGSFVSDDAVAFTSTRIFATINSLDADQDSEQGATASVEITPLYDGSTLPVVVDDDETLSAQAYVSAYALGPAKIGTMEIPGLIKTSVMTGFKLIKKRYAGNNFVTHVSIQEREPMIRWTFEDKAKAATLGAIYAAMGSNATQYFRKRTAGGTYVANGTGQHISVTLTAGMTISDSLEVSNTENGTFTVTAHGKGLAISTSATITEGT